MVPEPAGPLPGGGWEGLVPSRAISFQDLLGHTQEFLRPVPVPARLFADCGWDESPVTGPFRIYSLAELAGLVSGAPGPWPREAGAGVGAAAGPRPDRGLHVCRLMHGWTCVFSGPLAYDSGDRPKAKRGYGWVLGGTELLLFLWPIQSVSHCLGGRLPSQMPL